MGNKHCLAEVESSFASGNPEHIKKGCVKLARFLDHQPSKPSKDPRTSGNWPAVLNSVCVLLDTHRAAELQDTIWVSPEFHHAIRSFRCLPKTCVNTPNFQSVLQRNVTGALVQLICHPPREPQRGLYLETLASLVGHSDGASSVLVAASPGETADVSGLYPPGIKQLVWSFVALQQALLAGTIQLEVKKLREEQPQELREFFRELKASAPSFPVLVLYLFYQCLQQNSMPQDFQGLLLDCIRETVTRYQLGLVCKGEHSVWSGQTYIKLGMNNSLEHLGTTLYRIICSSLRNAEKYLLCQSAFIAFQPLVKYVESVDQLVSLTRDCLLPPQNLTDLRDGLIQCDMFDFELELSLKCLHSAITVRQLDVKGCDQVLSVLISVIAIFKAHMFEANSTSKNSNLDIYNVTIKTALDSIVSLLQQQHMTGQSLRLYIRFTAFAFVHFRMTFQDHILRLLMGLRPRGEDCYQTLIGDIIYDTTTALTVMTLLRTAGVQQGRSVSQWAELAQNFRRDLMVDPIHLKAPDLNQELNTYGQSLFGYFDGSGPWSLVTTKKEELSIRELLSWSRFIQFKWGENFQQHCSLYDLYAVLPNHHCIVQIPPSILNNYGHHDQTINEIGKSLSLQLNFLTRRFQLFLRELLNARDQSLLDITIGTLNEFFDNNISSHIICYMSSKTFSGILYKQDLGSLPSLSNASCLELPDDHPAVIRASQLESEVAVYSDQIQTLKQQNADMNKQAEQLRQWRESTSCAICFEFVLAKQPCTLTCGHMFCYECIDLTRKRAGNSAACPMCRTPITNLIKLVGISLEE